MLKRWNVSVASVVAVVSLPAPIRVNASAVSLDIDFSSGGRSLSRNSSKIVRCVNVEDIEDCVVPTSEFKRVVVVLSRTACL